MNCVNFILESPLNFLDLDLGKNIEPCNSFLAKVRELESQKARESQGTLKKNWVETLKKCHNLAEFAFVKACLLRVNQQI